MINLSGLIDDYEQSKIEALSHRVIKSPIVIQINLSEKIDLRRMQSIARRLIFQVDREDISSGLYLSQMTPGKIPVIKELFDIDIECFLDKKLKKLVANQDFYNSLFGFDTLHDPGIEDTKNFFIRYTFSLKPEFGSELSAKEHINNYFEQISISEMYHNIFNRKVKEIEPFLKGDNRLNKVAARFSNERFGVINFTVEPDLKKPIFFSDFGYKKVEQFHLLMRMFFQHFSDSQLMRMIDSYNFDKHYPYLQEKEKYVFSYSNSYDDVLEEVTIFNF